MWQTDASHAKTRVKRDRINRRDRFNYVCRTVKVKSATIEQRNAVYAHIYMSVHQHHFMKKQSLQIPKAEAQKRKHEKHKLRVPPRTGPKRDKKQPLLKRHESGTPPNNLGKETRHPMVDTRKSLKQETKAQNIHEWQLFEKPTHNAPTP